MTLKASQFKRYKCVLQYFGPFNRNVESMRPKKVILMKKNGKEMH